jgi:hypothetical protein
VSAGDGWLLTEVSEDKAGDALMILHVTPCADERPHDIDRECPCHPKIVLVVADSGAPCGVMRSHNAWDGRE